MIFFLAIAVNYLTAACVLGRALASALAAGAFFSAALTALASSLASLLALALSVTTNSSLMMFPLASRFGSMCSPASSNFCLVESASTLLRPSLAA